MCCLREFAKFQTESHGLLFKGEAHVAVAFFTGHFPPKPGGSLKSAAARAVGKFYLRNDQTGMSAAINIKFDQQTFPGNFEAHFSQSSPACGGPQCWGLVRGQLHLALFTMAVPTNLECQRSSVASLSKADLSPGPLGCQI